MVNTLRAAFPLIVIVIVVLAMAIVTRSGA
jgi:hypothetical protein